MCSSFTPFLSKWRRRELSNGVTSEFMTNLVDQYLLFRIRSKRDPEAFGRLYDRYVAAIYRFVYLKMPSKEAAEDVTSETFLRIWQYIQQNNDVTHIRALLYRIARNLVVDAYRKQESSKTVSVTFMDDETSNEVAIDVSDQNKGRILIETRADFALLLSKISRLKEDYQDVLTLRLVDGLSFGDIAKVMEKSVGNVRVIYHRALKALESLSTPPSP